MAKIVVPTSGGKDSQATLIFAVEKYGAKNVEAVFCDTKWEHELTYKQVDYITEQLGTKLIKLISKKYNGMLDLAIKRKRFPSSTVGFCTEELKIFPMTDWVLQQTESLLIFQGIRADESRKRAKMSEECTYFKYYFQPYKSNDLIIEKYNFDPPKTPVQKKEFEKAKQRKLEGFNDEKYFTYRKKDVLEWCKKYAADIYRPFFKATGEDVLNYSLSRNYLVHPFYFMGFSRVGCFPCKNATMGEMKLINESFPETIIMLIEAEIEANSTFFSPDYIPKRYLRKIDPKSGKLICTMHDVINYLKDKNAQLDMHEELETDFKCKSVYNICEQT